MHFYLMQFKYLDSIWQIFLVEKFVKQIWIKLLLNNWQNVGAFLTTRRKHNGMLALHSSAFYFTFEYDICHIYAIDDNILSAARRHLIVWLESGMVFMIDSNFLCDKFRICLKFVIRIFCDIYIIFGTQQQFDDIKWFLYKKIYVNFL